MKILLTGGAGFIGSAVARKAISMGYDIVNVDCLTYAANLKNIQSIEDSQNYKFEKTDICNSEEIRAIFDRHQPDFVMHLAAESHVDRSIENPETFIQTNVVGTYRLLEESRLYWGKLSGNKKQSFRFHHVSTDEVYGDLEVNDPAFEETTAYSPSSPYSASKAASDHLVRAWGRTFELPVILSNCSNNYGSHQFPEKFIPTIILKALHKEQIPVYGKGENIRDWLHVDDHADALLTVLKKGVPGETYNIGGNNELTNIGLVKIICRLMDIKVPNNEPYENLISYVTDRPGHDMRYAVNASKIATELGWEPKVDGKAGFSKTIDWYVDNQEWWKPLVRQGAFGQRHGAIKSTS
ncbi:dTDP-glucose 4,6-dehydratase [Hellea sp.]|nr:dTDP-glucose 4,6-dehydratase [Hellea sp.]MDC1088165.1 dTDP-glucose 4,6-dehydratase [Hellea sp.]